MNPKISTTQNSFGAKSWRSCLQLLIALAILCGASLARAVQTDTWVGSTATTTSNQWAFPANWGGVGMTTNGDALRFGVTANYSSTAGAINPVNNFTNPASVTLRTATNNIIYFTNVVENNGTIVVSNVTLTSSNVTTVTIPASLIGIGSITLNTNGYTVSGNAVGITNGITDSSVAVATYPTGPGNTESIPLTLGASQIFANNSLASGTNGVYFTNTDSGTINLQQYALTVGGSHQFFLTGAITSTNGGQVIVNNGGTITRLSGANAFGTNVVQITSTLIPASSNITFATNLTLVETITDTNLLTTNSFYLTNIVTTTNLFTTVTNVFYFTNLSIVTTNGGSATNYYVVTNNVIVNVSTAVFKTNTFAPMQQDAVEVLGGTLQLGGATALPSGNNVGNVLVNGILDLNGQNQTINGLEGSGTVDNVSTANTGIYTLTVGNGNSNAVFNGIIQDSAGQIAFVKTGYGKETLNGGNQWSNTTTISQGTLAVGASGSLGQQSSTLRITSGAVLDVSALHSGGGYYPYAGLTVYAGTPDKPYTNLLGSFDPFWGTNPTNYVVTITTNHVTTYVTNTDYTQSPPATNIVATTNFLSYSYSTNSIISVVTADVIGDFNVTGGGQISPLTTLTSSGIADWTINGALSIDNYGGFGANRINFVLNNSTEAGGGTNDLIAVNGPLYIGDELDFVITPATGSLTNGEYTLMTSTGYTPTGGNDGDPANLQLFVSRGLVGDYVYAQANKIMMHSAGGVATPGTIVWAGTAALGAWDVHLSQNWLNSGTPDYFYSLDNAIFADSGVSTVTLPLPVSPGSMTFNNNKTNITFAASANTYITGSGGLTMNGSGTVTLQNPNNFTGDIAVNKGTLNIGYYGAANPQADVYSGVPAGNLILGGGVINELPQANTSLFTSFSNLTINPGASTITQSARTSSESARYSISNNVIRHVGGVLDIEPANSNAQGLYFWNTNSPDGTADYGVNGILGGYATIFLNDWVTAHRGGLANALTAYLTDNNPADWVATNNVALAASTTTGVNTMTINSLKFNTGASSAANINAGQTLTLGSGGILVPTSTSIYQDAINGGFLQGDPNDDLTLINNNIIGTSSLTIGSVITNNSGPCGLTTAGGGLTVLTGNNTFTGPVYINNGFNGAAAGTLQVGANGTSGSIATASAVIDNGNLAFNRSDNTSVGGVISGSGNLKKLSAGVLTLTADSTLSGTVTVAAGTLQLGNGGTSGSVSNAASIVNNGTLVIDNSGIAGYPNPISGYGNFVQFGSGNYIIATNEAYTGNTTVSNGTLTISASGSLSNTAAIAVKNGTTLDVSAANGGAGLTLRGASPPEVLEGSGTVVGSLTTASGTTVLTTSTGSGFHTLTISGNLTLNGGNINFHVSNGDSTFSSPNGDHITANGNIAENAGTIVINVTGGALNPGAYPLIHYPNSTLVPDQFATNLVVFGFNQPGDIATLQNNPTTHNLQLVVAIGNVADLTWVGDGVGNIWNINGVANWNNGSGTVTYANPDFAFFDDSGSASPAVNIGGQVAPTILTNNANVNNYVLGIPGGAGKITGGAQLVQNGTSTLTLQSVNDYLGGTMINAGVVQLGNNTAANADGMIGGTGAILLNGTLVASNFATETIAGNISGTGQLVQQGVGALVLAGNNTGFSGGIWATNTLQMGNGVTGTLGSGPVTNNRALLLDVGPNPTTIVPVPASISGSGNVTNIGPGIAMLAGNNSYAGSTVIPEGTIQVGSATAIPSGTALVMNDNSSPGLTGTLDLNGHDVTIASLQGSTTGTGTAAFVASLIVNNASGAGTNTLTVNGSITNTTFDGQILDNNNGGTGKVALMVNNYAALTLGSGYNNLGVNTFPNLFSGGITVSNAFVYLGINQNTGPNTGTAAAGIGTITLEGGQGTVITNGPAAIQTNGTIFAVSAIGSNGNQNEFTSVGIVNVPAGQFGTIVGSQRGTFTGTLTGGGTLIYNTEYVRDVATLHDGGFTGTLVLEAVVPFASPGVTPPAAGIGGNLTLGATEGFANANVFLQTSNTSTLDIAGNSGGNVLQFGSLSGGDNTVALEGGNSATGNGGAATIFAIGSLNQATTNVLGAGINDVASGIRKVGIGTLILTNSTLSFGLQCVVSNGTLTLAPIGSNIVSIIGTPGAPDAITNWSPNNYPINSTYLIGTNITIVSPGILDLSQVGSNTLYLGHQANQTLYGNGTLNGNLTVTNVGRVYVVSPGRRASDPGIYPGNMTVNGTALFGTSSTFVMNINRTSTPTYDSFTALGGLTINAAALIVNNAGDTAFPGQTTNVFRFFPAAVSVNLGGVGGGITNITATTNLPAGMFWVTNLDGTLAGYPTVPAGSMAIVNTNPFVASGPSTTPFTLTNSVNGGNLTLSWPLDHTGYRLQAQTNTLANGLSNNWVDVDANFTPAANTTNSVVIPIGNGNGSVFYRLIYP